MNLGRDTKRCAALWWNVALAAVCLVLAHCSAHDGANTGQAAEALTTQYSLFVSTSPLRGSPVPLGGATLSGNAYVFTSDSGSANPSGIAQVRYWLDNPAMTGTPTHVENLTPYDFVGTLSDGTAAAWDTSTAAAGSHTISQSVTTALGSVQTFTSTFTVKSAATTTVPKWSIHEIALTAAGNYTNAYTGVAVTATFTDPAGVPTNVQGYWDGGSTFRVRFAPTVEGTWTYAVHSSPTDAGLTRSGSFDVVSPSPGNHGFVRRDPSNPYSFVFDDQTRVFIMGQTYYGLVLNALDNGDWQTSVTNSKKYGFSKIRLNLFNWVPGTGAFYGHPYAEPFTSDHDHVNLAYWQKMDEVVSYIESQGMIADLITFADDAAIWGTSVQNDRYLRYAMARYASHRNLTWCVSNEWNYTGQPQSEFDHLGGILAAEDPYASSGGAPRARSVHQQTRIDFQFFGSTWPAHAIIQYGPRNRLTPNGDEWGNSGILYNRGHGMPIVNDEYGYIDFTSYPLNSGSSFYETRTTLRSAIWGITMAGGYGTFGGDNTMVSATSMPIFSGDWLDQPGYYGDIQRMVDFWTTHGIPYWRMTPQNSLVSPSPRNYLLTDGSQTYVVYAAAGGSFSVTLPSGDYSMLQYKPLDGSCNPAGCGTTTFSSSGSSQAVNLATSDDWVILFTRTGSAPIRYVQSAGAAYWSGAMTSFPVALGTVTAGDAIVMALSAVGAGALESVTDSQGNVYQEAVASSSGGDHIYYAKSARPGATTVTATFTAPMNGVIYAHEYAGLNATSPLDQTSAAAGTAATFDSGAKATTFPNELIFGYAAVQYRAVAGTAFNARRNEGGNQSEDRFVGVQGSYAASFSQLSQGVLTSGGYSALMATFH